MWQIIIGFILFIGGIGNSGSDGGAFLVGILLGSFLIYLGLKKISLIGKPKEEDVQLPPPPAVKTNLAALELPRRSPSGKYSLSYHYDDVKFYPPVEIISNVPQSLLISGAEVILRREPHNVHDSGAIALYVAGHKIGYILRGTLQDMIHDYAEKGWPIEATLISLKKSGREYRGYISLSYYRNTADIPQSTQRLGYGDIDIKSIKPTNPDAVPNTPLTGKKLVFCGYFDLPLEEMMQRAVDSGATLRVAVTKTVDYLIVGKNNSAFLDENGLSSKEATATRLNEQGVANIRIISENTFIELTQLKL